MRRYRTIEPGRRTARDIYFLAAIAVALGLGLALASPVLGAGLGTTMRQIAGGTISGTVTVSGGSASGITVELRQRSNGGDDKVLAGTITDAAGNYSFAGQPSAPNDAFYYVKFTGGKNTLEAWYSFPIIYLMGSNFTVPSVEMSDVQLLLPPGSTISLPTSLQWKARRSGETYRLFIYAQGDLSKSVLDSGSLGMSTEFGLAAGSLSDGKYEAVVQVRDAVVGYGQSRTHFQFTIGKSAGAGQGQGLGTGGSAQQNPPANGNPQPPSQPAPEATSVPATSVPSKPEVPAGSPNLQLDLSADYSEVQQGGNITYKILVSNTGDSLAPGVVVTDKLPAGVAVDSSATHSSLGSIAVQGNSVTVQLGDLAPNSKATVEIPVTVGKDAGSNLSNQASAQYQGAQVAVNSNAYIAQVAAPVTGGPAAQPGSQPQQPPASQPQTQPQAPSGAQPQAPANNPSASKPAQPPASQPKSQPAAPQANPPASQPQVPAQKKPAAPVPQTGGSFPLVLAMLILLVITLARYLRGRSYRRV